MQAKTFHVKRAKRATTKAKRPQVDHADTLWWQLQAMQSHEGWTREHRFHPVRMWRLDLANVDAKLAVEVEGLGSFGAKSRHQYADGFAADCEKYAELACMGWRLIRCTSRQVHSGQALTWIERAMLPEQREG